MKYYDLSKELFSTPSYPGDPEPKKESFYSIDKGDVCNLTVITYGSHNGTHLDAPKHFCKGSGDVTEIPLEKCIGPCRVVCLSGRLTGEDIYSAVEGGVRRLLIKGEIVLTREAARAMADSGLWYLGVESQTVGDAECQADVHRILLGADIVIAEGLVMDGIAEDNYFLMSQPLKLGGLDGSPIRPVLIRESECSR